MSVENLKISKIISILEHVKSYSHKDDFIENLIDFCLENIEIDENECLIDEFCSRIWDHLEYPVHQIYLDINNEGWVLKIVTEDDSVFPKQEIVTNKCNECLFDLYGSVTGSYCDLELLYGNEN